MDPESPGYPASPWFHPPRRESIPLSGLVPKAPRLPPPRQGTEDVQALIQAAQRQRADAVWNPEFPPPNPQAKALLERLLLAQGDPKLPTLTLLRGKARVRADGQGFPAVLSEKATVLPYGIWLETSLKSESWLKIPGFEVEAWLGPQTRIWISEGIWMIRKGMARIQRRASTRGNFQVLGAGSKFSLEPGESFRIDPRGRVRMPQPATPPRPLSSLPSSRS